MNVPEGVLRNQILRQFARLERWFESALYRPIGMSIPVSTETELAVGLLALPPEGAVPRTSREGRRSAPCANRCLSSL